MNINELLNDINWNGNYKTIYDIIFDKYVDKDSVSKDININNLITFDIETSNGFKLPDGRVIAFSHKRWHKWYKKNEQLRLKGGKFTNKPAEYNNAVSLMYIWQLAVEDMYDESIKIYMGRTWEEFYEFLTMLDEAIALSVSKLTLEDDEDYRKFILSKQKKKIKFHIYIHNLSFEFQHLRNVLKNIKGVFAREQRKVMKFETEMIYCTIVFHDSLCLTQKSLENWSKDEDLEVKKFSEAGFDYLKIRTPETKLTKKELLYCRNDVECMVYGLRKYREKYDNKITRIPMTATGEVRIMARKKISHVNTEWAKECYEIDHSYDFELYKALLDAFCGGWTHANKINANEVKYNVRCFDFASSYPSVLTSSRHFPISKWREIDEQRVNYIDSTSDDLEDRDYVYIVKVEVNEFWSTLFNTFWSSSKCNELENELKDNGKIQSAERAVITMTDIDWQIFKKAYHIEDYKILKAWEADAGYICKEFILTILDYFADKTALKGTGEESRYRMAKVFINSLYGCCVTKLQELSDEIVFNENWGWGKRKIETIEEFEKALQCEDKSVKKLAKDISNTFTTWGIGVYTTALARQRLWDSIFQFDDKIVYCDTDSCKGEFTDDDLKWFDEYNKHIGELQKKCADFYNFDVARYSPLSSKGEAKQLGIFEREEDCVEFKTIGAKRYVANHDGKLECTIAGLPKASGLLQIKEVDDLSSGLYWQPSQAGKLMCHYNDNQGETIWRDKQGNVWKSSDNYGIMLEPVGFDMSITSDYEFLIDLVAGVRSADCYNITSILR